MRMGVAGAPSYFKSARKLQRLIGHSCINLRPSTDGLYAWEFEKGGRGNEGAVGTLTFNHTAQMLSAALAGFGLTHVPEDLVQA
jgi:DNA-binding transcriptional LysR family regulator